MITSTQFVCIIDKYGFNYCIIEFDEVLFLGTCTPNIPNCCLSSNQEIHPESKGRV